ncbi:translation initiation factor IF-5A [Candidatus Woesearchaeota archaeon]|nr:translation initiation factor IF-5A [Candidatus Woesearchaeota archaeon]
MDSKQIHVTELKVGSYVIFDGTPCIVRSIQTSKPGKHGHAKCRVEAIGIKDGRKIIQVMPGHNKVESPIVEKRNAQVLSISGDKANVMDLETYETFDVTIPEELTGQIVEGKEVLYWVVMGERVLKQSK